MGAQDTPCIRVYNKCDVYMGILPHGDDLVCVSAKTGEGLDKLRDKIAEILNSGKYHAIFRIPYTRGDLVSLLQKDAAVLQLEYAEDCTVIEAVVKPEMWGKVKDFSNIPERKKEAWE